MRPPPLTFLRSNLVFCPLCHPRYLLLFHHPLHESLPSPSHPSFTFIQTLRLSPFLFFFYGWVCCFGVNVWENNEERDVFNVLNARVSSLRFPLLTSSFIVFAQILFFLFTFFFYASSFSYCKCFLVLYAFHLFHVPKEKENCKNNNNNYVINKYNVSTKFNYVFCILFKLKQLRVLDVELNNIRLVL